jgi:peptidoglycan hydrolase-like protein with peptidoglycan-binding domain
MCGAATADPSAGYVGTSAQPAEPTQMIPGAMAMAATQQVPQAQAPAAGPQPGQPGSDFDALFRQPEGVVTPHSQTRLLPPVDADYRMAPPGTAANPAAGGRHERGPFQAASSYQGGDFPPGAAGPQGEDGWEDDEPGIRKPVLLGTIGAVVAASAVILGLLYIGSHSNSASANATTTGTAGAVAGTPSASVGDINLPAVSATSGSPSATASPSQSATGNTNLPLTLGSSGKYVTYVQERLRQLRYYRGSVNGHYDSATAQAVIEFQAAAHVTADPAGTVDRPTITALIAAGTRPNLHPGVNDAGDVKRLQNALNVAENAGLQVSGRYDAATAAAVATYQSSVGVPPAGSMNAQTWAALQSGSVI